MDDFGLIDKIAKAIPAFKKHKMHEQWISDIENVPYKVRDPEDRRRFVNVHVEIIYL